jgi:hypothetical protein
MMDGMERAERLIRRYAGHLAEHPRSPQVEVSRYPPGAGVGRSSIHLTAAFHDDGTTIEGIDHAAFALRVARETGLEIDPEYTGVFNWRRRNLVVYWWDWRQTSDDLPEPGDEERYR